MSRIKTPTIVQPGRRKLLVVLLLVIALVVQGWQIFSFGRLQGGLDSEQVARQSEQYLQQIEAQREDIADLRARAARYKRQAQVEEEASRQLREELIAQRRESDELTNEVALLRSLMSKKSGSLYIKRFALYPTEAENHYRYQLIVAQALDNVGTTKGKLMISIEGLEDGKSKRLDYKKLTEGGGSSIALSFQHYQDVNGVISLPTGFDPVSVVIEVQPKDSKKLGALNKQYDWVVTGQGAREEVDAGA